jgi:hypothetical protein
MSLTGYYMWEPYSFEALQYTGASNDGKTQAHISDHAPASTEQTWNTHLKIQNVEVITFFR